VPWCLEYDPETKRQSAEWTSPEKKRPMKVRASKSKTKTMLITFFDSRGIIHREFLRQGSTITGAFYRDVLDRLLKRMRRVRPELLDSGKWWLLHNNAPAHKSIIVQEFLTKRQVVSTTLRTHVSLKLFFVSKAQIEDEGAAIQVSRGD